MSQFIFNGTSRMRNVTFARDHHRTGTSIIEDARRQRLRREEEARRTRAAQRLQRAVRQWLAGLQMMRVALDDVRSLPADVSSVLSRSLPSAALFADGAGHVEERLVARLHAACWSMSYAVAHPSRIPIHGVRSPLTVNDISRNEEKEEGEGLQSSAPATFRSLAEVQSYQRDTLWQYGDAMCTALRSCANEAATSANVGAAAEASSLWQRVLSALSAKDVSLVLYVVLQQLPHIISRHHGETAAAVSDSASENAEKSFNAVLASVVSAVVQRNTVFRNSLNEENGDEITTRGASITTTCYSLLPSSPAYVDRWPAVQALTISLELASQEAARAHVWVRNAYADALMPLLCAFPAPPSTVSPAATEEAPSVLPTSSSSSSSSFARACWRCMCAAFSDDEYLSLSTNPLVVLLSSGEAPVSPTAVPIGAGRGVDGCCTLLFEECCSRTASDTRLTMGEEVGGVNGGPLRARVLGRLVRLLPYVQELVRSAAAASYEAAAVVKRYLLSVSCLSERLCREPFFIESILADHYAYNTGQHAATLAAAAAVTGDSRSAVPGVPRSQYRLLPSYLFSTEGGLRLLQLLTAEDETREQLRLQALQKPTVEAPTDAIAPLVDASPPAVDDEEGNTTEEVIESSSPTPTAPAAADSITASPPPLSPSVTASVNGANPSSAPEWPTSASVQQSPLEILCNVFAWPLFTFSKPDYSRYQQETLALCAKLVRTPQLLRRLWSLYWQSCEGLRAVLPPGPELQKLCSHPVWGEGKEETLTAAMRQQERVRGRRVPVAAATAPLLSALPRLPTWETHPRYPMAFYDPHPSLSIFLFTLLAHYVNVCDFADELRRGDTGVLSAPEACALVLALKEIVHRAHLYGVVPDSNGEAVAHAACLLLSRLHIVNEADPFVPAGADGLWMSVGMVAAEAAVGSVVARWDDASAAVVDEERAAVEEEEIVTGGGTSPSTTTGAARGASHGAPAGHLASSPGSSATANAVVLSRLPGDDLMFHGSRGWDNKLRYTKLLVHTPFLLPFPARALLLSALLARQNEQWTPPSDRPAVVHRGRTFVDAYDLFHNNPMSSDMYNIRFVSEDGALEAGYGRGVYRECIVALCKEGFAAPYGLFNQTPDGYVFPNSFSAIATADPQHLQKIRFLGAMVGRALCDGVLQDVPFAQHFRNAILGRRNTLSNLKSFDPELYYQLMSLTQLDDAALQAVGLTFVYTVNSLGVTQEVELLRGGAQMDVTPRNCLYYVHLVADFKLNREAAEQTQAFCAGLHSVLDSNRLLLFDSNEVGKLFAGDEGGEIDLQDWKENTVYDSPDDVNKLQVRLFWEVVESLTRKQQSQLLKFATSMTRPPLLGFRFLSPPFKLQLLQTNVSGADYLPSASTCFSMLKLPPYRDYATARAKIIAAIEETGTFEYS
jgi:ubiquitin-protein ligase E3 C